MLQGKRNYSAIQVQKSFRGFHSRKYKKDHGKRKRYLQGVAQKGDEIREAMQRYAEEQTQYQEMKAEDDFNKDIKDLTGSLHHLMSTKQRPGIYNPNQRYKDIPTIRNVPVEEHLRHGIKDLLRTKGVSKVGLPKLLVKDINGTNRIPVQTVKGRLSLQASAPYEALDIQKKRDKILHKILLTDRECDFVACRKPDEASKPVPPLSVGDPFMESWANPMLMRGVPESQSSLLERAHTRSTAPTFAPPPEKPFVLAWTGNKSSTMPNELFDVIADATQSGGVLNRHLGKSVRFGVADSCDNRPLGPLPAPPLRTTTLRPTKYVLLCPIRIDTVFNTSGLFICRVAMRSRRQLSSTGYVDKIPVRDRKDRFSQTAPQLMSKPVDAVDPYASSDED